MELKNKKCSSKEHEELNAFSYCPECKINMCNKCEIIHTKLCQYHHPYKLDKDISEIYTGFCSINEHNELLEFYCKTHNTLCCGLCICKIKSKGKGQHSDCEVCIIEEIKEQKISQFEDNLKKLKNMSVTIECSIKELKLIFQKINENKEELEKNIQKVFTKIRNIVNNREEKLLSEINSKYEDLGFKESIIKNSEKLPLKIKKILENLNINNEKISMTKNNEYKLDYLINDCLVIENSIKDITEMNEKISRFKEIDNFDFKFEPEEVDENNEFIKIIDNIGNFEKKNKKYSMGV